VRNHLGPTLKRPLLTTNTLGGAPLGADVLPLLSTPIASTSEDLTASEIRGPIAVIHTQRRRTIKFSTVGKNPPPGKNRTFPHSPTMAEIPPCSGLRPSLNGSYGKRSATAENGAATACFHTATPATPSDEHGHLCDRSGQGLDGGCPTATPVFSHTRFTIETAQVVSPYVEDARLPSGQRGRPRHQPPILNQLLHTSRCRWGRGHEQQPRHRLQHHHTDLLARPRPRGPARSVSRRCPGQPDLAGLSVRVAAACFGSSSRLPAPQQFL